MYNATNLAPFTSLFQLDFLSWCPTSFHSVLCSGISIVFFFISYRSRHVAVDSHRQCDLALQLETMNPCVLVVAASLVCVMKEVLPVDESLSI